MTKMKRPTRGSGKGAVKKQSKKKKSNNNLPRPQAQSNTAPSSHALIRELRPFRFTVRNGAGVYRTNAGTLKQARAELADFFGDELVSVERYRRVDR